MFTDMYETRQNGGNALWLPANTGFSTEATRSMQWLLHELSSVISFIPQLSSQKPFLRSSGHDLPGFQQLDWVNNFLSELLLLPASLALLFNPLTSPLFSPLSLAWFDPTWRRRRRKRARRPEENIIETILRYNDSSPPGQVQDFLEPFYPEDDSEETKEEITTSCFSSDFVRRRLPSLIKSRFPLSRHQKESMIISNLAPTARISSNYSDSIDMLHWLANDRSASTPSPASVIEGIYAETPHREMNSPIRFIQPYAFSSKVPLPLLINLVTRNQTIEEESPFWPTQLGKLSQVVGDRQAPAYQRVFMSSSPNLFTHPVHQVRSLPLTNWLTTRLQQWLSENKTSPAAFNMLPEQKMTNSVIGDLLPDKKRENFYIYTPQTSATDTTLSQELPDVPTTSVDKGSQYNFEQTSLPSSTYLSPFAIDFQQAMNQTAGDLPLAIRNSISLTPYFQENPDFNRRTPHSQKNMASNAADAIVKAIGNQGKSKVSGYHTTEGIELALAPVGRPRGGNEASEAVSTREQGTERRTQAEEATAPDYEALATEVYDILKRKLFIEKERAQGIR